MTKGVWERNDAKTKASSLVGKSMTKNKGIIAQSVQHNRNVLINERSIKIGGVAYGRKGASNVRNNRNYNHTKEGVMNYPRAERSGNSLVVGRLRL